MKARLPRLPPGPLVSMVAACGGPFEAIAETTGRAYPEWVHDDELLLRCYYSAVARPHMTPKTADRLAIQVLGLHPCLVWGLDWWDGTEMAAAGVAPGGTVGATEPTNSEAMADGR